MSKKQEAKVEELESVGRALSNSEAFIEKSIIFVNRIVQRLENSTELLYE